MLYHLRLQSNRHNLDNDAVWRHVRYHFKTETLYTIVPNTVLFECVSVAIAYGIVVNSINVDGPGRTNNVSAA